METGFVFVTRVVTTEVELKELVEVMLDNKAFSFDTETMGTDSETGVDIRLDPRRNEVVWLSFATHGLSFVLPIAHPVGRRIGTVKEPRVGNDGKTRLFKVPDWSPPPKQLRPSAAFGILEPLFFSEDVEVSAHNLKFDLETVQKYYGNDVLPGPYHCTLVSGQLLNENFHTYKLGDVVKREFDFTYDKSLGEQIERYPFLAAARYANYDAKFHWLLRQKYGPAIERQGLSGLWKLEMDLLEVLLYMEATGALIDVEAAKKLYAELGRERDKLRGTLFRIAGKEVNLNSHPQMSALLFGKKKDGGFGLKSKSKTGGGKPSTAASALEIHAGHPFIDTYSQLQEVDKIHGTYLKAYLGGDTEKQVGRNIVTVTKPSILIKDRLHANFKQTGTTTGRFSCSTPNLQNIPRPDTELGKQVRGLFIAPPGHSLVVADYCLAPSMRVLTTDWRWVAVKDLDVGDEVVGFPEDCGKSSGHVGHVYAPTPVISKQTLVRPGFRVTTTAGVVECSSEHQWLGRVSRRPGKNRSWVRTEDLRPGMVISHYSPTWEYENSYESGYIAGFLDGEGYVSSTGDLGFGQLPGAVLNKVVAILRSRGFNPYLNSVDKVSGVEKWRFRGHAQSAQVLGWCRPVRLLAKAEKVWVGRRTWGKTSPPAEVLKVESVGDIEVIALGTGSRTFIAEGLLSHNCQIEYVVMAHFSRDPVLVKAFDTGVDLHTLVASMVFGIPVEEVTKLLRTTAKNTNFAVAYGAGDDKVAAMSGISLTAAEQFRAKHRRLLPTLYKWTAGVVATCRRTKPPHVQTLLGRKRRLPMIHSQSWGQRGEAERQAVNSTIQGSAADIIKLSMVRLHRLADDELKLSLTIHDELVLIAPDDRLEDGQRIMREAMLGEGVQSLLSVPMNIDMHVVKRWSDAKA